MYQHSPILGAMALIAIAIAILALLSLFAMAMKELALRGMEVHSKEFAEYHGITPKPPVRIGTKSWRSRRRDAIERGATVDMENRHL